MKKYNYCFIALVAAFCVYVGVTAWSFPKHDISRGYGPGFYPILLVAVILLLCVILLIQTFRKKPEEDEKIEGLDWQTLKNPVLFFACVLGFAMLLRFVGLWIDAFLFLMASTLIMKAKFSRALMVSAISSTVVYWVFTTLLRVPFPKGVIF